MVFYIESHWNKIETAICSRLEVWYQLYVLNQEHQPEIDTFLSADVILTKKQSHSKQTLTQHIVHAVRHPPLSLMFDGWLLISMQKKSEQSQSYSLPPMGFPLIIAPPSDWQCLELRGSLLSHIHCSSCSSTNTSVSHMNFHSEIHLQI